jgi:lipopolysaccharide/colanic/teichoic acid biosynthesis glycosyltransferase
MGRFLRRTGFDEIPQLWNVLVGDMALVGPRPFVPRESEELDEWVAVRFEVRPGITGLWQVSGRNDLSVDHLERLDYLYVASWSMWWDMKILWDTPKAIWRGTGAY